MRRCPALLALLALALPGHLQADASVPPLEIEARRFEFGERHQFETIVHRFTVRNISRASQTIVLEAFSLAAEVHALPPTLAPGEAGSIEVRQPLGNRLGQTSFRVRVSTATAPEWSSKLVLSGFVESAFDPERIALDYGRIDADLGATADVAVASREVAQLEVFGLEDGSPTGISWEPAAKASAGAGGPLGRVRLSPGLPLGIFERFVRLRTNVPAQPWLEVQIRAEIFAEIVPERPNFDLGAIRVDEATEDALELRHRAGLPFLVVAVDGAPPGGAAFATPCSGGATEKADACWKIHLRVLAKETGLLSGTLSVRVDGLPEPLPIDFAALAVAPGTEVRTVPIPDARTVAVPGSTSTPPDPFGGLLQQPSPTAASATGNSATASGVAQISHRRRVVLTWKTTKETGLYGFLVYRADARTGPFLRRSAAIVRAATEAAETHSYRFEDTEVENGKTYWYYIDAVTIGGKKLGFTGVIGRSIAPDATP